MVKQPGELDRLLSLRRPVRTPDGMGGATVTYETVARLWAKVRPMSGRERFAAAQIQAESTYVITIRRRSDILETDVLEGPMGVFDIQFIGREDRSPYWDLQCTLSARELS